MNIEVFGGHFLSFIWEALQTLLDARILDRAGSRTERSYTTFIGECTMTA